jgi:hypothetical protein
MRRTISGQPGVSLIAPPSSHSASASSISVMTHPSSAANALADSVPRRRTISAN